MKKLYIAYGSNINLEQMAFRCPDSKVVTTGMISDYELQFRQVATIEPKEGSEVPVLIWELGGQDELSLDRYEGFPHLYRKEDVEVEINGEKQKCMAYVMNGRIELSGSHSFCVENKNVVFEFYNKDNENSLKPSDYELNNLELSVGSKLKMIYDFGADLNFEIKLTAIKEMKKGMGTHYPYVLSGAGAVIPEDLSVPELMERLESEYKEYDCEIDNALLKGKMQILKNQYESK